MSAIRVYILSINGVFHYGTHSLRDRSRVVPRSDSACVFTKRSLRRENAGFTKSRRVIGEDVNHPLLGGERVTRKAGACVAI